MALCFCWTDKVTPACLPGFDQQFEDGLQCWTTGFGTTEEGAGRDLTMTCSGMDTCVG